MSRAHALLSASAAHRWIPCPPSALLQEKYEDVLGLGGAGCDICKECTYPDAPCRFPKKRMSGMEGYGLVVADVCRDNGLLYYYGKDTITYTGMFLIKENKKSAV